jgi:GWxTD domain-containing protein
VVFYYYEVYEKNPENKNGTLKLDCDVFNSKGKLYYSNVRIINKGYSSRVEVGTIPIFKYPTDSYALRIGLIDSADNYGKFTYKKFYVYNPEIKIVDTIGSQQSAVISSNFGILSVEECDDLFEEAKYIASEDEIDQYKKINTTEAKREYLYNFWKKRENNPEDPKAIPYKDFIQRVAESNQKFTSMKKPGWKTDRGRVLIEYGEPSEIDRNPNSTDTKPYETWRYNEIQGGVIFVFADLTGFSDYQIVNSTARGEYRDDNWQSRISVAY